MTYTDQEGNEFTSFRKQRSKFIEPFMKKEVPNVNKPPGAKRAMMIPEPVRAPQPKMVYSIRESAASQQHVPKSTILPPGKSPILPLLTAKSTISILSPLPATPKLSSSVTKDFGQKGRKYISSSSSDDSSYTNWMRKIPPKQSRVLEWMWYPMKSMKSHGKSLYKPSVTVLNALPQDLLKQ